MYSPIAIQLTDGQRNKIRCAFRNKRGVTIQLSESQLRKKGSDYIALTEQQIKSIQQRIKDRTGLRLTLSEEQLRKNHEGGFLPLVFAGIGALAALLSGGAAVANSVIDYKDKKKRLEETKRHNLAMERIQVGRGLKKKNSSINKPHYPKIRTRKNLKF